MTMIKKQHAQQEQQQKTTTKIDEIQNTTL